MKQLVSMRLTKAQLERIAALVEAFKNDPQQTERITNAFVCRLVINEGLNNLEKKRGKNNE